MPCEHRNLGGGSFAIICTRGNRQKPCQYCGHPSSKLCDFKLAGAKAGRTCDVPMCEKCAMHIPPDTDFCKSHAAIMKAREAAGAEFDKVNP